MGCDWYAFETYFFPGAVRVHYDKVEEKAAEIDVDENDEGITNDDGEIVVSKKVQIYLQQNFEDLHIWKTEDEDGPYIFVGTQDIKLLSTIEVPGPYEIDQEFRIIKTAAIGEACVSTTEKDILIKVAKELASDEIASWVWSTNDSYNGYTKIIREDEDEV